MLGLTEQLSHLLFSRRHHKLRSSSGKQRLCSRKVSRKRKLTGIWSDALWRDACFACLPRCGCLLNSLRSAGTLWQSCGRVRHRQAVSRLLVFTSRWSSDFESSLSTRPWSTPMVGQASSRGSIKMEMRKGTRWLWKSGTVFVLISCGLTLCASVAS